MGEGAKEEETMTVFDTQKATVINQARLHHLATLALPLEGKTVLEAGAGIGKLTGFFEELGCEVTSVDGRERNCRENLQRHPWRQGRVICADLEGARVYDDLGLFDVVFCYGFLYHIATPTRVLRLLSGCCSGLFLLETRVCRIDDGRVEYVFETERADEGLHGQGCRPSRSYIMAQLRRHFPFAYATTTQPAHEEYPTRWPSPRYNQRAVFVGSWIELDLSSLTPELPMEQDSLWS